MRKTSLAAGLMVAAMVLSSCWTISAGLVTAKEMSPGGVGKFVLDMRPLDDTSTSVGYPFVLVGYSEIDPRVGRVFDVDGNWGGPWTGTIDGDLVSLLMSGSGVCSVGSNHVSTIESSYTKWLAFRTPVTVSQAGALDPRFRVEHGIKRPASATNSDTGQLAIFSGTWNDDGDGIPEAAEVGCAGSWFTSVPYVP